VDVFAPALLWAIERLVRRRRSGAVAAVTACALLGGMPEAAFFSLLLGGAYVLARGRAGGEPLRRVVGRHALASLLGLLLAAPAVLPFLELVSQSFHNHGGWFGGFHWDPRAAVLILDPGFYRVGHQPITALGLPAATVAPHVGAGVAARALVGAAARGGALAPLRLFLAGTAVLYLLVAYGAPGASVLGRLPVLDRCHLPKYGFPVFALAVAGLAAAGAERLARGPSRLALPALALPAAAVLLWRAWLPGLGPAPMRDFPGRFEAALAGFALLVLIARLRPSLAGAALAAGVLGELVLLVPRGRAPRAVPADPPFVRALRDDGADRPGAGRVFAQANWLHPNWGAALGFEDARMLDALTVRRYVELVRAVLEPGLAIDRWSGAERPRHDALARWFRFLNVRWWVAPGRLPSFAERLRSEGLLLSRGPGSAAWTDDGRLLLPGSSEVRIVEERLPGRATLVFEPEVPEGAALDWLAREEPAPGLSSFRRASGNGEARIDLSAFRGREAVLGLTTRADPPARVRLAGFRLGGREYPPEEVYARAARLETPAVAHLELAVPVPEDAPELRLSFSADGAADVALTAAAPAVERVVWSSERDRGPGPRRVDLPEGAGPSFTLVARARGGDAPVALRAPDLVRDPAPVEALHAGGPFVYRIGAALPRAFVVHEAEVAATDEAALARLRAPGFDPARHVVLAPPPADVPILGDGAAPDGRAIVVRHESGEVEVEARLGRPGYLVVSEVHYPGWRVEVDGRRAPLLRANHAFRAVFLREGSHRVRFRYVCVPFLAGVVLASLALVALIVRSLRP
jgi:hypothetical protein